MTSAKWSLAISPYRQWFGIHPQKKCLYGSCGIQHQMPRDLGGILSTCAFGNRQTDLVPGYGSWSGPWTGFRPSWSWSRKPVEHWLRQSPMDKRAFVGVQEFSGGDIKACCWSKKKSKIGHIGKSEEQPFPKIAQLNAKTALLGLWFYSHKVRVNELLNAQLPQLCRMLPETHFSHTQPRILSHELHD